MEKFCTSCGQAIKMSTKFCKHCGKSLEEPNKLVITDTFEKTRRTVIWCCVSVGIILTIVVIPLIALAGNLSPMAFLLTLAWWGPIALVVLLYAIIYRHARKPRIFTLSDKTIEINIPNKSIFQIGWDEFDTLQIKKRTTGGINSTRKFYDLIFTGESGQRIFNLERWKDFTNKTSNQIRDLLGEYAIRLNKEYIYGKKKKK